MRAQDAGRIAFPISLVPDLFDVGSSHAMSAVCHIDQVTIAVKWLQPFFFKIWWARLVGINLRPKFREVGDE